MSGPRYSARGRSKCRIRKEKCRIRNEKLTRAVTPSNVLPDRPQHARAGPVRLAPRPAPRGSHWAWGGSASARASGPDEPVILGERAARRRSRCRSGRRTPRAARTSRGTGWRAGSKRRLQADRAPPFKLRQARAPRCSCGCCSAAGGSVRTARRSEGQGGVGGGQGGKAPTGGN
jgi:hypothetical protein